MRARQALDDAQRELDRSMETQVLVGPKNLAGKPFFISLLAFPGSILQTAVPCSSREEGGRQRLDLRRTMQVHTTSPVPACWRRCIQRECVAFLPPESSSPAGLAATAYWMARRSLSDLVLCRLATSCRSRRETGWPRLGTALTAGCSSSICEFGPSSYVQTLSLGRDRDSWRGRAGVDRPRSKIGGLGGMGIAGHARQHRGAEWMHTHFDGVPTVCPCSGGRYFSRKEVNQPISIPARSASGQRETNRPAGQ